MSTDASTDHRPGDTAAQLVRMWADVLHVPVRPDDAFLDLGGDSLTAMSCIFLMRDAFGVDFEVDEFLMDDSTVATFAARIDAVQ